MAIIQNLEINANFALVQVFVLLWDVKCFWCREMTTTCGFQKCKQDKNATYVTMESESVRKLPEKDHHIMQKRTHKEINPCKSS